MKDPNGTLEDFMSEHFCILQDTYEALAHFKQCSREPLKDRAKLQSEIESKQLQMRLTVAHN